MDTERVVITIFSVEPIQAKHVFAIRAR